MASEEAKEESKEVAGAKGSTCSRRVVVSVPGDAADAVR